MAAELKVGIGAETTELKAGLKDAEAQIKKFLDNVVTIGKVGEKLQSIGTKLSVGVTAPIVALSTVALKAFSDLEGVRIAFNRLNDPTLLDNLRKATKGTTSDLELMQAAVKSEKFGLSTNALPTLLEYAGRVAKDTGQEVSYLVDSITTGIGRKSPLILDNLGISASQLKAELGGVSMEAASVATVTEAVGRIAARELAKMGKDTKTLSESWLQVKTAINNSMGKIGEIISKNLDISGIIDKLTGYINSAVSAFENLSPSVQKSILVVTGLVAAAGPLLVVIGSILAVLPSVVAGFGAVSLALGAVTVPALLVTAAIAGIIAAVVSNWDKITPYLVRTANNFIELYNESKVLRGGILSIGFAFESLYAIIKSFVISGYNALKGFGKAVLGLFEGISLVIRGVFNLDTEKGPKMIAEGWAKANQKVAFSFDNIGGRIDALEGKYSKLLKNDKPLKFVTEADLKINTNKSTDKAADNIATELKSKIENAPAIKVDLPDIEPIGGSQNFNFLDDFGNEVKNAWNLDDAFNGMLDSMKANVPKLVDEFAVAQAKIAEHAAYMKGTLKNIAYDIENAIGSAIGDTVTDMFSSIGEAIGSGGDVMAAMGQSLLNSFGGFLSNMGKMMAQYGGMLIAYGIAEKVLKFSPDPFSKIAAGAALLAIGGAMSLVGGAIKGASSGGSSGGSIPSGGGGPQSYSSSYSSGGSGSGEVVFRISGNDLVGVLSRQTDKNTRLGG